MSKSTKAKRQQPPMTISKLDGSKDAKRAAMTVLEVMAGLRKPAEAHEILGVSLARYYAIEARALQGLITSLENRDLRRGKRAEVRVRELERELKRMRRELDRAQTLVRMAQRTVGIKAAPSTNPTAKKTDKKGKRRRKPTVRAKKVAKILRAKLESPSINEPMAAVAAN
jgi:hypothetical protein